jgi:predicted acetyltransferase
MGLRLRPLRVADEAAALGAHEELAGDSFIFLLGWDSAESWPAYLELLDDVRRGRSLPEGWVRSSLLAAVVDGDLVGRASIRFELNDFLLNYGGHIGYAVRPAFRRRGFATEILRQSLIVARAEGVDDVLVTCDEDNLASARVIERQGGVFEDRRVKPDGVVKRRYWIA